MRYQMIRILSFAVVALFLAAGAANAQSDKMMKKGDAMTKK